MRTSAHYPARTRTWKTRTKTWCVANYTTGQSAHAQSGWAASSVPLIKPRIYEGSRRQNQPRPERSAARRNAHYPFQLVAGGTHPHGLINSRRRLPASQKMLATESGRVRGGRLEVKAARHSRVIFRLGMAGPIIDTLLGLQKCPSTPSARACRWIHNVRGNARLFQNRRYCSDPPLIAACQWRCRHAGARSGRAWACRPAADSVGTNNGPAGSDSFLMNSNETADDWHHSAC